MVILEDTRPGHMGSRCSDEEAGASVVLDADPVFNLRVPASRIVGGYTIKDGVIVPNYSHSEIIDAVFRRTRVTVGLMTFGQAPLGGRAGHPLPAPPFPRRRRARRARRATILACSRRKTCCTG